MNTSEVLNRAADLIQERGHRGGGGWPGAQRFDGRLCLEGGIMAAAGITWANGTGYWEMQSCPAYKAVREYLEGATPFMWQDDLPYAPISEGTGGWVGGSEEAARAYAKERVIAVLRAAAVIEAAREEQDAAWETYAEQVTA